MGGDSEQPRRKHRATGRPPPGGKRDGSGRPKDAPNLLEYGETSAIRAMKLRVPKDASYEEEQLAGEAFENLVKVMRGEVLPDMAAHVRNAAKDVREEICKPIPKPMALTDADGKSLTVNVISLAGEED